MSWLHQTLEICTPCVKQITNKSVILQNQTYYVIFNFDHNLKLVFHILKFEFLYVQIILPSLFRILYIEHVQLPSTATKANS